MGNNLSLRKSNDFITSKYKTTVLENKIMAIALTRIEENGKRNEEISLEAKLYPGELKRLFGGQTNIYTNLKKISKSIVGHGVVIEDGIGNFKAFSIVPNAKYENGVFTIYFNNELRPHILGLKKNYTTLEISVICGLTSNASIRIYELLKKEVYKSNPDIDNGRVTVRYNINEFRFMIGLADIEEKEVKNAMARMGNEIDWDYLFEKVSKKKTYSEFKELKRRILDTAKEELNNLSNIRFEYEGIRTKGNKYGEIEFHIYPNIPNKNNEEKIAKKEEILRKNYNYEEEENYQYEYPEYSYPKLFKYLGHNYLSREDLILLLSTAKYDEEKVINAIELADKQDEIDNYIGWLIKCIKNEYKEISVIKGSAKRAERIEELEKSYKNESVKERVWKKTKEKEDFKEFLEEIGINEELLEKDYPDISERIRLYTDWRMERNK